MSIDKHDLIHDFPEHKDAIHTLKMSDAHFQKLFDEYHDATHKIHDIENNGVDVSDEHFEALKKQRVHLKDELYQIILKHSA